MNAEARPPLRSRREILLAIGGGGATLLLAACSGSTSKPPAPATGSVTPAPTSPDRVVPAPTAIRDVTSFGAVGDGSTDDTAAIRRALATLTTGQALLFPAGKVFCHNDVIKVQTAGVQLLGPGALKATNEQRSALQIEASDVLVAGLTIGIATTSKRWSTPSQHKLYLGPHSGITVSDVTITGSAAAGLFCLGASDFVLERVSVSDTRADGIHMTYGSHDGTVTSPHISRSGDDGVAVVSYTDDKVICTNITITNPRVETTTGGRGLSVVGGKNIKYLDINVSNSNAAGVYIACEGGDSVTFSSSGVRVTGGSVTGANTNGDIDHGAVLVYSGRNGGDVDDVVISDLTIRSTRVSASRQIGVVLDANDVVSGIAFQNLDLSRMPKPYQGNASSGVALTDVTSAGKAVAVSG